MNNKDMSHALYRAIPLLEKHMSSTEQRFITLVLEEGIEPKVINPWDALCDPKIMARAPLDAQYEFLGLAMSAPLSVLSIHDEGQVGLGVFNYESISALVVSEWYVRAYRNGLVKEVLESDNRLIFLVDERHGIVQTPDRQEFESANGRIESNSCMVYINPNGESWTREIID